jgi:hypothetical protein
VQFEQNQQKVVQAAKPDVAEGQKIIYIGSRYPIKEEVKSQQQKLFTMNAELRKMSRKVSSINSFDAKRK